MHCVTAPHSVYKASTAPTCAQVNLSIPHTHLPLRTYTYAPHSTGAENVKQSNIELIDRVYKPHATATCSGSGFGSGFLFTPH